MFGLKSFTEMAREWSSVNRGSSLAAHAAHAFQTVFNIDAGVFLYIRRRANQETIEVHSPWGFNQSELEMLVSSAEWLPMEKSSRVGSEHWLPVSAIASSWIQICEQAGIRRVGWWPIIVNGKFVGAIVLGTKTPDRDDEDLISVCANYVSLMLEMLILRRIAENASRRDPLTNILNRRGFAESLPQLIQDTKVRDVLYLCVIDINDFKQINDTFGHSTGDEVLKQVAVTIEQLVGSSGLCARFGGDEFVFIMKSTGDVSTVMNLIQSKFSEQTQYTVSVGCAIFNQDSLDWESCYRTADKHMYEQKGKQK